MYCVAIILIFSKNDGFRRAHYVVLYIETDEAKWMDNKKFAHVPSRQSA